MKPSLTLFAICLLSVSATACGSTSKATSGATQTSSNAAATNTGTVTSTSTATPSPSFTHTANASDTRTITALVKRYYATALAEDGAKACSILYSTVAESVPEDYGTSTGGLPYAQGKTCPVIMTLLFKHFHHQLTVQVPHLKVTRVRLNEHHGLAVLAFGTMPERQIQVAREGHTWKIEALLDSELSK